MKASVLLTIAKHITSFVYLNETARKRPNPQLNIFSIFSKVAKIEQKCHKSLGFILIANQSFCQNLWPSLIRMRKERCHGNLPPPLTTKFNRF